MVRIRFPPAASLMRTWLSGAHPIDNRQGFQPTPGAALARGTSIAAASDNDPQLSLYWRFGRIR